MGACDRISNMKIHPPRGDEGLRWTRDEVNAIATDSISRQWS